MLAVGRRQRQCPSAARLPHESSALAIGGIGNARLLLAFRRTAPEGLGNRHDLVGRYPMNHRCRAVAALKQIAAETFTHPFSEWAMTTPPVRHTFPHGVALS
ncbi:hypothetical protein [Nocardia amikacinitolerans]|uniref:hypothetical protein n=1 Tax=Nocardia amikacinitolerans TaxID=756689 RepID=UPI000A06E26F|nr:hypothetical protein [Nocardia amikacinitolerans]